MRQELRDNPDAYAHDDLEWANQANPDVLDELGELLNEIASQERRAGGHFERSVFAAIGAPGDEGALAVYDRLISDPDIEGSGFYRCQRNELARRLAAEEALARLPQPLADVALWTIKRGFAVE
jgi:hypothetical protein